MGTGLKFPFEEEVTMRQGTNLGSQIGRWIILAALVALLGALLLTIRPVFAQSSSLGVPTGLKAVAVAPTIVELSWTAPVAGRASVTGYKIERSADNGGTWAPTVPNTEADTAQNVDTETLKGVQTHYAATAAAGKNFYRVSAINDADDVYSDPTDSVSVTPPADTDNFTNREPGPPSALMATANGSTEINLSWVKPSVAGADKITMYRIEYSKDGRLPWMAVGTTTVTTSNDGTTYSNKNLAPNTTRNYRVSAKNTVGWGTVYPSSTAAGVTTAATPGDNVATTEPTGVPAAPTRLTATAVNVSGAGAVELSWTAPSEGRAPIKGYKIGHSTDKGKTWTVIVVNTEMAVDNNDTSGRNAGSGVQTYYAVSGTAIADTVTSNDYRVSAMNAIGTGPVSTSTRATLPVTNAQPGAPGPNTGVMARPDGSAEIEVEWTAPTTGLTPFTGYKIEYSKDNELPWMEVATVGGSITTYDNKGLSPGTTRYYRVSAMNRLGWGPVSATDGDTHMAKTVTSSATPGKPTGLKAMAVGPTTVELSWTAPVAGRDSVTGYKIEHSDDNGASWDDTGSVANTEVAGGQNADPKGVQTHYAATATAATANLYRVSSINDKGTDATGDDVISSPTASVSVTPPADTDNFTNREPGAPSALMATANGSTEINLSWAKPDEEGVDAITMYRIEYSKDGRLPWMAVGTTTVTTSNDGTTYSDKNLAPDTTRNYRVSAKNTVGWGTVYPSSTAAGVTTAAIPGDNVATTELAGVPAAPTRLTATAVRVSGDGAVELSWTAPSEGRTPIEGYKIGHSTDKGKTWTVIVVDTEMAVDNNDTSGRNAGSGVQTYYAVSGTAIAGTVTSNDYRVSATNAIGTGPVSAPARATLPVTDAQPGAPGPTAGVMARPDGSAEIEVEWSEPGSGLTPFTGYKIEYSKDNELPWMEVATVGGSITSYSNTGLAPGTTRYYRVSAMNRLGWGPVSATPAITVDPNANNTDHVAKTETHGPLSLTGLASVDYPENGTDEVGTYTPQGPNADSARLSLEGDDKAYFRLERSSTGTGVMLKFRNAPNYEDPKDEGGDNFYEVTVKATHGTNTGVRPVVVSVTNVIEVGMLEGMENISHEENDTAEVDTYTTTGQATARWTLDGPDRTLFTISGGMLRFGTTPNYEMPRDTGKDNTYEVTVKAEAGGEMAEKSVMVMVTNMDEDGMVTLSPMNPVVDTKITASLMDPDNVVPGTLRWEWRRSMDMDSMFMYITGADMPTYTPKADDEGYYLRAVASYDDEQDITKEAMKTTTSKVVTNNAPMFDAEMATRMIDENSEAGTAVGEPVTATDADMLTYALSGADAMYFTIDNMGQIKVGASAMLDYESMKKTYMVTVTATDPDGETDTIAVTINVSNVNEAPMFETDMATREVEENTAADMAIGDVFPEATDPDAEDSLTYSLGGDDKDSFDFDAATRQIKTKAALDYETKSSYSVMVIATDSEDLTDTIEVTINVTNVNEAPMFAEATADRSIDENSAEDMAVGDPVTATDPDAGDTLAYSLSGDDAMYFSIDDMGQITVGADAMLDYEAEKSTYMVTVTATDDSDAPNSSASIAVTINVTDVNEAPMFETDMATREVAENTAAGMNVGAPVTATDADTDDTLAYTLSGDDAMYFTIDSGTGQIMVGMDTTLDYEAEKSTYMVTVTATDDSDAPNSSASIAVTINVTDVEENPLLIKYDTNGDGIDRGDVIAAIRRYFAEEAGVTRAEVIAVIRLYFAPSS